MGLTSTGLTIPSLDDIQTDLATSLSAQPAWSGVDTSASSVAGQLLRAVAEQVYEAYSLMSSIYAALDPESATGSQLDRLLANAGLARNSGESDAEFRQRFYDLRSAAGAGSVSAIAARLRQLDDLDDVAVAHNPTDYDDTETGLGPHEMWVVAYPDISGDATALAAFEAALWGDTGLPAGVKMVGSESASYYDSEHEITATIRWDWASDTDIYVDVTVDSSTSALPGDAEDRIKTVVEDYIDGLVIGHDVLPDAISAEIIDHVPGIRSLTVKAGRSASPTSTDPVTIDLDEISQTDSAKITVTL